MTRAEILTLFHKKISKEYSSGAECVFIKLDKTVGLKLYRFKHIRNHAFKRQKQAFRYGLSPPVYGKISIPGFTIPKSEWEMELKPLKGGKLYGYITGLASIGDPDSHRFWTQFHKLAAELRLLGFSTPDLHETNVGYYKRKLVVIDFGPMSMK